jgi:hypothetical protein
MADIKIKVDKSQVENLGFDFHQMAIAGLHRVVEVGERFLREEVPKVTHNLSQGISSTVDDANLKAELSVSARTGRLGVEGGLLHLPGGGTREIQLRGRPAFDYAEAVARGTGIYGPSGQVIRPRTAKGLLIPIGAGETPVDNRGKPAAFIESGGQRFIVRRFTKGRKADPYDVRAADRLEKVAPAVFDEVIAAFANQQSLA